MQKEKVIVISPSKLQNYTNPISNKSKRPILIDLAKPLFNNYLANLSLEDIKYIYKVSYKLANHVLYVHKEHGKNLFQGKDFYVGQVFKQLEWDKIDFAYACKKVFILDPLYGLVRFDELVGGYRLDMLVPIGIDLYTYWQKPVNEVLKKYDVYSLASNEYEKMLTIPYTKITLKFDQEKNIKINRGKTLNDILINKLI